VSGHASTTYSASAIASWNASNPYTSVGPAALLGRVPDADRVHVERLQPVDDGRADRAEPTTATVEPYISVVS